MYVLFILVFTTRYLDLLEYFISLYNTVMKILFITLSCVMVYVIHVKFPSIEKNVDSFRVQILIIPVLILALLINHSLNFMEVVWTFSIYLEAVAVLPQLFLVRNTDEINTLTCYGVAMLAAYRGFYILNWIYRYVYESRYDSISVIAGTCQTVLYSWVAAVMVSKHHRNVEKSRLAYINSLRESMSFQDSGDKCSLQDKKAVEDCDEIIPDSKVKDYPVPYCIETDMLKIQNSVAKDDSLPQVFLQKKKDSEPVTS